MRQSEWKLERTASQDEQRLSLLLSDFNSDNCHESVGLSGYRELDFG